MREKERGGREEEWACVDTDRFSRAGWGAWGRESWARNRREYLLHQALPSPPLPLALSASLPSVTSLPTLSFMGTLPFLPGFPARIIQHSPFTLCPTHLLPL